MECSGFWGGAGICTFQIPLSSQPPPVQALSAPAWGAAPAPPAQGQGGGDLWQPEAPVTLEV